MGFFSRGLAAGAVLGAVCGWGQAMQAAPEESYSAVADAKAVVVAGHARFTVLTPEMVRMEWAADGKFEDRPSFVFLNRRLTVPAFRVGHKGKGVSIETSALKLEYVPAGDGRFSATDLTVTLKAGAKVWHPGMEDKGNLEGTTRTLDGALGGKTQEPMDPGLVSRDGWTVVDDSARPLFDSDDFTFKGGEKSEWPWVVKRAAGDRQDWYFFGYGHEYRRALADYVKVAGRIPLPPRFAFGAWWSRYWAYSDQELDGLVDGFRENHTPLDVLVIDMDWHDNKAQLEARGLKDESGKGHDLGWTGYSWNRELFPDPADFLAKMHREGLKATLNLHPASGVQPWETAYPAMAKAMGQDPAEKKYVPFDIASKKYAGNYMDLLHHPLEKQGIDFWWLDWQQEKTTSVAGVNPTWWLNYVHFTDQEREGKRPLLFHRWGGMGNHRYQIGFSGDTVSKWESLAFQPWFTATAANVGYAYWSHDIGGHMPGAVDPELYTRWVQFGAFSPILRTHTTKNPESERRIWAYPEPYAGILRSTFKLRYALEPYVYTEARRTYDTGTAFLHPLYYDYPEANEAYSSRDEYAFGEQMLVAPVTKPVDAVTGLAAERVWLPEGEWVEWATGKRLTGPKTVERKLSISDVPVYLKAGAIVPMQPPMEYTGEKPVDPLILNVWPVADGKSTAYTLYEDGSQGEAYKHGVYAETPVSAAQHGDVLTVEIAPVKGSYPGMLTTRGYELRLPGDLPPVKVTANGQELTLGAPGDAGAGWSFDGNMLSTIVRVPSHAVTAGMRIEVTRAPGSLAKRGEMDGFAGATARLHTAYDTLNTEWPLVQWSPDALIHAWQTGDRMSYYPETAAAELDKFAASYAAAMASIQTLADAVANVPDSQVMDLLAKQHGADTTDARGLAYKTALKKALAQLEDGKPGVEVVSCH